MKTIIKGRRYDTDTAAALGTDGTATLYRSPSGLYFLCSDDIMPLDMPTAKAWADEKLPTETVKAIFALADVIPGDGRIREQFTVALSATAADTLRKAARDSKMPVSRLLDRAILAMFGGSDEQ